ncbi:MAG: MOSC N-terminal beta barrel domain-containing protein [Gemmatimonadota bacterium]
MRLQSLHVYPIKSAGGFTVDGWDADEFGLRYDRRWMLISPDGTFITQRDLPGMALLRTEIELPMLTVNAPGASTLRIPLEPAGVAELTVRVWKDRCAALLPSPEADAWFSEVLRYPCRLAYLQGGTLRPVDPSYTKVQRRVSFADAFPFLIIGMGSLDDLNQRLVHPVPMNRFRPNLVVSGGGPFAEDGWETIRIGSLEFDLVKPCARCLVPTTDQATGMRHARQEPLRTLATYRRQKGMVMFGQNALHSGPGRLNAGDEVEVLVARSGGGGFPV